MENSYRFIALAIDSYKGSEMQGRIFHESETGTVTFNSLIHMILMIEGIFARINYPMKTMDLRQFDIMQEFKQTHELSYKIEEVEKPWEIKGDTATIQLQVKHRYNATWQGELMWTETGKQMTFKSVIELLKILDEELVGKKTLTMDTNKNGVYKVAVDECKDFRMAGTLYQPPQITEYEFTNVIELMHLIDSSIIGPEKRNSTRLENPQKIIPNQVLKVHKTRGQEATFIIRVLFAENSTWQGTVVFIETEEKVSFRSFLELIMLMCNALTDYKMYRNKYELLTKVSG